MPDDPKPKVQFSPTFRLSFLGLALGIVLLIHHDAIGAILWAIADWIRAQSA